MSALAVSERLAFKRWLCVNRRASVVNRRYTALPSAKESHIVRYPEIKSRYPPGQWGSMNESSAWYMHRMSEDLLTVPRMKERLEKISGEKKRVMWIVEPMDERPKNIQYRQMLMKTHIAKGLPDLYNEFAGEVDSLYERLRPVISNTIDLEHEHHYKVRLEGDVDGIVYVDKDKYVTHRLLGGVLNALSCRLSRSADYLRRSQIDENVRVETFWYVGGFKGEGNTAKGKWSNLVTSDHKNLGVLMFQYRHKADWQIRTENPPPQFVDIESAVCIASDVPRLNYGPGNSGFNYVMDRPITLSGHWIGDPCEYSLLSMHVMPTSPCKQLQQLGDKVLKDAQFTFGMTTAFGSCVAQAHNQGFTYLHDMTYPLTAQCLVTDGRCIQLFAYQLNTLRLWIDEDGPKGNPRRNVVWASEAIPLFEGDSHRPNADAFKLLLRALLVRPAVRQGIDMRPYLPHEEAPVKRTQYINLKGEDPLPSEKIGRFQYPRNAVYF